MQSLYIEKTESLPIYSTVYLKLKNENVILFVQNSFRSMRKFMFLKYYKPLRVVILFYRLLYNLVPI